VILVKDALAGLKVGVAKVRAVCKERSGVRAFRKEEARMEAMTAEGYSYISNCVTK